MIVGRRAVIGGIGSSLILPACATTRDATKLPTVSFEELSRQMKHDVGTYIFENQDRDDTVVSGKPCGGQVSFQVQKVKMNVTATLEETTSANAGLEIPINLLTLRGSGSFSRALSNTITTSLTVWPITAARDAVFDEASVAAQRLTAAPPPSKLFRGTPIRNALTRLRNDLIATADTPPCFDFGQGEQTENVIKWAFAVTNKTTTGAGFSILVFSIGGEEASSRSYANTLEVSFIASGTGFG